jgi:hypothetical protein
VICLNSRDARGEKSKAMTASVKVISHLDSVKHNMVRTQQQANGDQDPRAKATKPGAFKLRGFTF